MAVMPGDPGYGTGSDVRARKKVRKRYEDGAIEYTDGSREGGSLRFRGYTVRKRGSWDFSAAKHKALRQFIFKKFGKQPWERR